ncbi:hypothetical protein KCP77_05000 [Salmonella enterica subsp. enterica]|nr:hypothetical protein KCP77_05000 [Salmonella enterica subsp. enterica]
MPDMDNSRTPFAWCCANHRINGFFLYEEEASVCGATLALMDAGALIKTAGGRYHMGLVKRRQRCTV